MPLEASEAVEAEEVDALVNDKSVSTPAKKRKYYHCGLLNTTTGKQCPWTLFNSSDIHKHLKRKIHFATNESLECVIDNLSPEVVLCSGSECEHCRRNHSAGNFDAHSRADRAIGGEVSAQ